MCLGWLARLEPDLCLTTAAVWTLSSSLFTAPWGPFAVVRSLSILTAKSRSSTSGCSKSSAKAHSGRSVPPSPQTAHPQPPCHQVRMVQHKQTRATYALKYINKIKAVKMKAVGNIIQERRLLEKVGSHTHSLPTGLICPCRLTTHSLSTFGTHSRTTKTASLSSTSCSVETSAVSVGSNPRWRHAFTPAVFRSCVQSTCSETTNSAKKPSASTPRNSRLPLSTSMNTVSSIGKPGHSSSRSFGPFLLIYHSL